MSRQVMVDAELLERLANHAGALSHADTTHEQRCEARADMEAARNALTQPTPSAGEVLELLDEYEALCASITRLENQTAQLGTPPGAMYAVKLERREAIRQHLRALPQPSPS